MSKLEKNLKYYSACSINLFCLFVYQDRILRTFQYPSSLGQLVSEAQGVSFISVLYTGISWAEYLTWLFMWVLEIKLRSLHLQLKYFANRAISGAVMALGGLCFSSSSHPGEETGLQENVDQGIMVSTVPRDGLLLSTDGNLLVGTTVFISGCCQHPM